MRKDDKEIFRLADYGQSQTNDALARFWRGLMYDMKMSPNMFSKLLTRYVLHPSNAIPDDKKAIVRGNLPKALLKGKLTWDSLCRGLRVLEADKADVYIVLHRGKKRTLKKIRVDLGEVIENGMMVSTDGIDNVDESVDLDAVIERIAKTKITK